MNGMKGPSFTPPALRSVGEAKVYEREEADKMTDWEQVDRAIEETRERLRTQAELDHERMRDNMQLRINESGRHLSEIALMAGMGENTIRAFINGTADTGVKRVIIICRALGISLADLLP